MRAGAGTEEVTQFIVASTEPVSRSWAFEPTHGLVSTFDATVILLQSIVQVAAGAVLHAFTQLRPDRPRVAVVVTRSGITSVTVLADWKNAFAAAMSRCSLNITSTSAPLRSMAR